MVHDSNDASKLEAISLLWGHGYPNAATGVRYRHNWLISGSHRGNQDVWEPSPLGPAARRGSTAIIYHFHPFPSITIRYHPLPISYLRLPKEFIPVCGSINSLCGKVGVLSCWSCFLSLGFQNCLSRFRTCRSLRYCTEYESRRKPMEQVTRQIHLKSSRAIGETHFSKIALFFFTMSPLNKHQTKS